MIDVVDLLVLVISPDEAEAVPTEQDHKAFFETL